MNQPFITQVDISPTSMVTNDDAIRDAEADAAQQIIRIFERLLKVRQLTADSQFIELTSDIRKAFLFVREFQRRFDFDLPLSAFFDAPTIKNLAEIAVSRQMPALSRIVLLRSGKAQIPPLFLVPGLGGVVFELLALSKEIAYGGSIYSFAAPGLDGVDAPADDTTDLACQNLELVRQSLGCGRHIRLLGHSAGGVTALEMARHAEEYGFDVDFFGVLDTNFAERAWPLSIWLRFMIDRARGKRRSNVAAHKGMEETIGELSASSAEKNRDIRPREAVGQMIRHFCHVWQKLRHRFLEDPASQAFVKADPYYIANLPPKFQRVRDAAIGMAARYRPRAYQGQLHLFQAEFGDELACDPVLTWSRLVPEIILVPTPGDHISMLSRPHVTLVAEKVSICLAELDRRTCDNLALGHTTI
jgi:thioesterase domain-containing protein